MKLFKPVPKLGCRHRLGNNVTLHFIAVQFLQGAQCIQILGTLSYYRKTELMGQINDQGNNISVGLVLQQCLYKGTVNFQFIRWNIPEIGQT